ncbi:hypothetical protein niasHS_011119 [Heterodera schachtii]|uniref:Uncharacterized protein n=1 Tax=Heterodera schachtii TaxID=97005 RepID=A0ABD2ITK5_HETSC
MKHLAVRFLRQTNLARIASDTYPLSGLNNYIHVVDPQLDFRDRFQGENAIELSRSILARKLSLDLLKIRNEYEIWCMAFKSHLNAEHSPPLEKRHIRGKLLDSSAGLLSVLELPNDLDRYVPSTSSKSEGSSVCDTIHNNQSLIDAVVSQINKKAHRWNSVQLRRFILSALQRLIFTALQPKPQMVTFPHLVRAAVVEACNLQLDAFPLVVENDSYLSLAGVDLPSLISPLIKCRFSPKSNHWPLVLLSSGNVYPSLSSPRAKESAPFGQNAQLSLLLMDEHSHECSETVQQLALLLRAFLSEIGLSFDIADVNPPNLFLYERSAFSFSHSTMELARFSNIGDYVSRRAQIKKMNEDGDIYLKMAFVRFVLMSSARISSADSSVVSVSNKGISLGLSSSGTSPSNVIVSSVPVKNHTFRGLSPIGDVTSLFRDVLGPLTAVRRQSPTVQVAAGAGGGIIAGYVFGKTSKMVAILLGSTVLFLQFAQCKGYLQIQNGKLKMAEQRFFNVIYNGNIYFTSVFGNQTTLAIKIRILEILHIPIAEQILWRLVLQNSV